MLAPNQTPTELVALRKPVDLNQLPDPEDEQILEHISATVGYGLQVWIALICKRKFGGDEFYEQCAIARKTR